MPQETKSHPTNADELEHAPGFEHEKLEGWIPSMAGDDEIRAALEKAFDYRGDVTITLRDQNKVEGYIFDRRCNGSQLSDCQVRLLLKSGERLSVRYSEIAALAFTGRDTAAGKSWETWVRKYQQRKAAGEKNIAIDPEKLD